MTLRAGGQFHSHAGVLDHDELIGAEEGVSVRTTRGARLVALRPTLGEYVLEMPRGAQVIYPKDLGPILIIMEAGLVLLLLTHVVLGLWVTIENWQARPVKYRVDRSKGGRTVSSSTMIYTGAVILGFMILHLIDLKFGEHAEVDGMADLYTATVALLAKQPGDRPLNAAEVAERLRALSGGD